MNDIEAVIETVHRLRAPGGCPWDREQTHRTLRPFLIEEAYEVLDVLDQIQNDEADLARPEIRDAFREELGDVLMQVLLHSEMASERGAFTFRDVARGLNDKLIFRHPHVFGDAVAKDSGQVLEQWEKRKAEEKKKKAQAVGGVPSVLDGLPKGLPALQKTARIIEKVTKVGFQWPDLEGPLAKVEEEWGELKAEISTLRALQAQHASAQRDPEAEREAKARIESEIGDLLFTVANVAYLLKIQPEDALRGTLARFEKRFRHVEKRLADSGKKPEQSTLEEMDAFWDEAKSLEKEHQ